MATEDARQTKSRRRREGGSPTISRAVVGTSGLPYPAPAATHPELPPPPYMVREIDFIQVGVAFDPEAIRPLVPAGLRLSPSATGVFYIYSAQVGWGITPYTALLIAADVEGHDSADGSKARLVLDGCYSERAVSAMSHHMGIPVALGSSSLEDTEGLATGVARYHDGKGTVKIVVEPDGTETDQRSGVHYYIGNTGGSLQITPVGFCYHFGQARPVSVEVTADGSERLQRLKPRALTWAGRHKDAALTFGVPSPLGPGTADPWEEETRIGVLGLFSQLGIGAVLVDASGSVSLLNEAAEAMMGDGLLVRDGCLLTSLHRDQSGLDSLTKAALAGGIGSAKLGPIAAERPSGRKPLLIRAVAISSLRYGVSRPSGACALLVVDPEVPRESEAGRALQLLGLTPAEARIASLVGTGLSPRETAERVGNTEGTVRSTLGRIFTKLEIARQSELAILVARLRDW